MLQWKGKCLLLYKWRHMIFISTRTIQGNSWGTKPSSAILTWVMSVWGLALHRLGKTNEILKGRGRVPWVTSVLFPLMGSLWSHMTCCPAIPARGRTWSVVKVTGLGRHTFKGIDCNILSHIRWEEDCITSYKVRTSKITNRIGFQEFRIWKHYFTHWNFCSFFMACFL